MNEWIDELSDLCAAGEPAVLVTVAGIRGSAPREVGSNMIVTEADVTGTIGGGYLENECIRLACAALRDGEAMPARKLRRFALGSQCGQCCGGVVDVLFERLDLHDALWIDALADVQKNARHAVLVTELATGADTGKWVVSEDDEESFGTDRLTPAGNNAHGSDHIQKGSGRYSDMVSAAGNKASERVPRSAAGDEASKRYSSRRRDTRSSIDPNAELAALKSLHDQQPATALELRRKAGSRIRYLLEPIGPAPLSIVLFGAGHVGTACAAVFGTLDATVMVVDSRADYLDADWPANATPVLAAEPERIVAHCPANSYYLVMTHDHAIDFDLCQAILARDDRAFCGLIGSRSKQRRFEKKLRAAGFDEATLATLTCPIGIDGIGGKQPGEIAIATAAQIVARHQERLRAKAGAREQSDIATAQSQPTTRDTADIDSPPGDNQPMRTEQQAGDMPPKPQAR